MISVLFDLILPRRCHSCGDNLRETEKSICSECQAGLPRTFYHLRRENPVEQRLAGKVKFERATSFLFYSADSAVARIIHDFKYRGFAGLARDLGGIMGKELLKSGWLEGVDVVMGVPLHWSRLMKRGYCQTHELAQGLGASAGIPVSRDLKAIASHKSQTRLSHEERLRNVSGVFRLKNTDKYGGKTILLIDDVCTTGGTLTAAAEALREGCQDCKIVILSLATVF